jgi:hypothetical protein
VGGCEVGGDAGALGARHRHDTPLSKLATLHFTMQHYIVYYTPDFLVRVRCGKRPN